MSNFVKVIKACENAGGAGSKLAIREALATADETAYRLIWEGLNKYRVWHVQKFDEPTSHAAKDADFSLFLDVLEKLATKQLRGNAARDAVTESLSKYTAETASYLARIIPHDFDAGFSAETFNKVLIARDLGGPLETRLKEIDKALKVKGIRQYSHLKVFPLLVPTFEVQLADKHETEEDFAEQEYPAQADVKYDGERNVAVVNLSAPDPIIHFSRSGLEAEHMQGIFDEQLNWLRQELGYDFVLDGERMAHDFTATMNAKKGGSDKGGMRIHAYFLMPLDHWMAQETNITMQECRKNLGALLEKLAMVFGDDTKIVLSRGRIVHNHHDMMDFCNEVIDGNGPTGKPEEGLILKKLNDVYRWERNAAWTKVKRFYPVDLRVIGWYYGKKGSRLEKVMGGVIVEGTDEKGKKIRTRIGSGFTDADRARPDTWKEITIEAKYQEMTMSAAAKKAKSDIFQLRFPTVERVRDDKNVPALQAQRFWGVSIEEAVKICGGL